MATAISPFLPSSGDSFSDDRKQQQKNRTLGLLHGTWRRRCCCFVMVINAYVAHLAKCAGAVRPEAHSGNTSFGMTSTHTFRGFFFSAKDQFVSRGKKMDCDSGLLISGPCSSARRTDGYSKGYFERVTGSDGGVCALLPEISNYQ